MAKAKQDIQALETALTMYRLDNSKYPTTDQGLKALALQPTDPTIQHWRPGGYIQRVSKDPWGNDYQYVYPGTHGKEYDLFSFGADGQPGGEGIDADIGNWNIGDQRSSRRGRSAAAARARARLHAHRDPGRGGHHRHHLRRACCCR